MSPPVYAIIKLFTAACRLCTYWPTSPTQPSHRPGGIRDATCYDICYRVLRWTRQQHDLYSQGT